MSLVLPPSQIKALALLWKDTKLSILIIEYYKCTCLQSH